MPSSAAAAAAVAKLEPTVSCVVSTLARRDELIRLLDSLEQQTFKAFEVIVIDQNEVDFLSTRLAERTWSFDLKHVRTPGRRGLSRGRNEGWRLAKGELVVFPDDDCWYPPDFLRRGVELLMDDGVEVITGRLADATGRSINGRFARDATVVNTRNVWVTQVEAVCLFRRSVLSRLGGYDESVGVGASTPWQAAEGPDLLIRAIKSGFRCRYEPSLIGHHEEFDLTRPEESFVYKGRLYARGMGYVLRKHATPALLSAYWVGRSALNCLMWLARGDLGRSRYYFNVALGRLEGLRGRVEGQG